MQGHVSVNRYRTIIDYTEFLITKLLWDCYKNYSPSVTISINSTPNDQL